MAETYRPLPDVVGIARVYRDRVFVGHRATVWVPDVTHPKGGHNVPKRFGKDTTIREMREWREDTRSTARRTPQILPPETPAGFAGDALVYLETVQAMPSISDRQLHMTEWILAFRDLTTDEITSTRIRLQRDAWLMPGPRHTRRRIKGVWTWTTVHEPLAPHSVNLRLRALENFFTVMYPKRDNPVRDVPECDEPEPMNRGTSFAIVQEILDGMPDRTRGSKGVDGSRTAPSKTKARIAVMLWTGLAHAQVKRLIESEHVDYQTMTYLRPRRGKGRRGKRNRTPPIERPQSLLPQAAAALRHFFAIGADTAACGGKKFSNSSLHTSWVLALEKANAARIKAHGKKRGTPVLIPYMRPYDVKHTFGGEAYGASKDLRAVQEVMGLSRIELADRYARTAVAPAAADAVRKLALRAAVVRPTPPIAPGAKGGPAGGEGTSENYPPILTFRKNRRKGA